MKSESLRLIMAASDGLADSKCRIGSSRLHSSIRLWSICSHAIYGLYEHINSFATFYKTVTMVTVTEVLRGSLM